MATTTNEDFTQVIDDALELYDNGEANSAIASFLAELGKRPETKLKAQHPGIMNLLFYKASQGREQFKEELLKWVP